MRIQTLVRTGTFALSLLLAISAYSQFGGGPQEPRVVSPEIHPDKKVTFRLRAPKAGEVFLNVIPFIERNYRVIANKDNRAIAGLSMGGGHTVQATNNNPGVFDWIGVWSAGG
jgi:hypothetical protein